MNLPPRYQPTGRNVAIGGMSHAIPCNDSHLNRLVLGKALQSGVEQRRILDEVSALTSILSKHVVQLYDVIRDNNGDVVALVEEFLPGHDLNAIIPVSDQQTFLRIAFAIACG